MDANYVTGVLVPLYIPEAFSEAITALLEQRDEVVFCNSFHQLEMENSDNVHSTVQRIALEKDRSKFSRSTVLRR